ncbi:MAG: hypothetical protein HN337_08865, partial [Deltaproteobacteria bacterium]|nr:hypothetical protein [Deltaproteobacteria bacterium]
MPDSSVQNPFSNPGEIGNIFQLMLDAFRAYDSSGDQRLHTTKELSLDDYTASLLDNYKTDSNITKFELKKAFRQWGNIARFLTFAPKVDELWDVTEHNGVKHLLRKSDDGFNIMNAAAPILKKLPAESAMKVAQRLYDFAHDFRYFCTIHKKTGLLEKYHPILIAMASEKWLGSGKPADIKEGIKALEVMHKWLRRVKDPEKFLKRIEAIGVAGGAKGILLSEKMYQVRAKLEKEPVAEGKKIIAVMDKRTGTVRYMTIAKADEAKLHLPDHELKIGATMITKKGGEKRKVAYMSKNVATICPWFIALGKQHISDKFTEAKKKLDALKVMSQRYPDKLLTEVIDPQMLKTFLLIEHIGGKPILDAAGAKDW